MTQAPPLLFNPLDPAFRADPYPTYARLRAEAPVHETPVGAFVVSRYDDCLALLKDSRLSSDLRNEASYQQALAQGRAPNANDEALRRTPPFLVLDPPDHTRLRGLVSRAFTPKVIERLRPRIQTLVGGLLDGVADRRTLELVEEFAYPLPVAVICELLGVPPADHAVFKTWSRELSRGLDPAGASSPDQLERRRQAGNLFTDYFRSLIAERRARPREDLLSALIAAEEAGERLTEDELLSTCILLLAAGHETTVNLIANGTLALLRHPDQLQRLRDEPALAPGAVEELLRYDAPVQMAIRIAAEDVVLGDATIRRGRQVILLLGSANRDPERFPEPDRLDLARDASHHLAFGYGSHFCLGAPLARVEGEIAFRALLRRLQGLTLGAEAPVYKEHLVLRGLRGLPVAFARVLP